MVKKLTQYQLTLQTPVIVNVHFMTFFHVKVMTLFQRGVNEIIFNHFIIGLFIIYFLHFVKQCFFGTNGIIFMKWMDFLPIFDYII